MLFCHLLPFPFSGMFQIWSTMGRCTVIAKKELFWAWPFGLAAWLAGLVFIPRVKTKADQAKAVINDAVHKVALEKVNRIFKYFMEL